MTQAPPRLSPPILSLLPLRLFKGVREYNPRENVGIKDLVGEFYSILDININTFIVTV